MIYILNVNNLLGLFHALRFIILVACRAYCIFVHFFGNLYLDDSWSAILE